MISTNSQYHLKERGFSLAADGQLGHCFFIRDAWEDFGHEDMEKYFNSAYGVFVGRLKEFRDLTRKLTVREEKELRFMMDALIQAKRTLGSDK